MHIPDGPLGLKTAAGAAAIAAIGLGLALREAGKHLPRRRVPLMGLAAAVIFAAQMVNFPIAAGTSGHLMGGVLAAVLLGPAAAVVVMSAVLIVQCLVFADGGVTALGANMLNMAILAPLAGYAIYDGVRRMVPGARGRLVGAAFAGWCSTVLAALACAGELALSGFDRRVIPLMGGVHMLIGLGEAIITGLVVAAILRGRPELLDETSMPRQRAGYAAAVGWGLVAAIGIAALIAPFASQMPDGLERVLAVVGFQEKAAAPGIIAPVPDYRLPGISSTALATALGGIVGTVIVFVLSLVLARVLLPRDDRFSAP